jgi:three-Cys-motif partner protein
VARYWGFWTRGKLDLLRKYLTAFTLASQSSRSIVYIDLFGGQPDNRDRLTMEAITGSAQIALDAPEPPFTHLRFVELAEPNARQLRSFLADQHASRDATVTVGDSNHCVREVLGSLRGVNWAPTFVFIDPNGPHVHWSTLRTLARFKRRDRTKAELFILFPAGMFIRNLRTDGSVRPDDALALDSMYGNDEWRPIYDARVGGALHPREARDEYVNLMRWQLEQDLGYQWTHSLEVFNERGHSIYHLIFATDHKVGHKIMGDLYQAAVREFPKMRRQAIEHRTLLERERSGVFSLFDIATSTSLVSDSGSEPTYQHEAPTPPYGRDR